MSKSARFMPTSRMEFHDVVNIDHKKMGQVQNFIIDLFTGRIAFVMVVFGTELFGGTIGGKWFAIPWEALKWHPDTKKLVLDMPLATLKNAPGMHQDRWLEEIDKRQDEENLAWLESIYSYYGVKPYWDLIGT